MEVWPDHPRQLNVNQSEWARAKQNGKRGQVSHWIQCGGNFGESAGQPIWHAHIHLIPKRDGDTPNPRGGVRGVIPDKMDYGD